MGATTNLKGTCQDSGKRYADGMDYHLYYDMERYLFESVTTKFHENGCLDALDFFTILDWKAQRATVYAARRMLKKFPELESAALVLTRAIHNAASPKDRLRILMNDWGFELPTASAILTVCYPNEFTVYDVRVCDMLGNFHKLRNKTRFETIWAGYLSFMDAVQKSEAPVELSLRDKDRWLWGKSDFNDLRRKISEGFRKEK
jgi:hypothetical protein